MPQNIELIPYNAPEGYALNIEIMRFSALLKRVGAARLAAPHRLDFNQIIVPTFGRFKHTADFIPTPCEPGQWLLIKAGQVQTFDVKAPWDGWLIVFRPEATPIRGQAFELTHEHDVFDALPNFITLSKDEHTAGLACIEQLARDADHYAPRNDCNALISAGLHYLLLRLQLLTPNRTQSGPVVRKISTDRFKRFKNLVDQTPHLNHSVQYYAQKMGCSEKSLNRSLQEVCGSTAKVYLTNHIVLQAKRLLVYTQQPIGALSLDLGFSQTTNFIKFFKREAGLSPQAFRRLLLHSE